jgi:glycosyltransferase involved in cell wall biosynthesis
MLKILVVVDHAVGVSGPHRNVVGSLNALAARDDVDLRLLTGRVDLNEPYASRCDIHLGFDPHNVRSVFHNLRLLLKVAQGRDLVYVPTGLKSFLYGFAAKGRNRKLVAGPNVTNLPLPWRKDSPGFIELKLMTDCWFEASEARERHVNRATGNKTIQVVHHAIDTFKFSPEHRDSGVWETYGIAPNCVKVLFVGNDKQLLKGVEVLIASIQSINGQIDNPAGLAFVFVGNISEKNVSKLKKISNAFPIGFLYPDKLPSIMASADLSVVPSSWENFPFSVLEAMASGLPIVAGRVGGIPEQVINGESGILVDIAKNGTHLPDAYTILADAILDLLWDSNKRQRLGENARERVLQKFSEERLGEDLVIAFRGCITSNGDA